MERAIYALVVALGCYQQPEHDPLGERALYEQKRAINDDELASRGVRVREIRAACELSRPPGKPVPGMCFWNAVAVELRELKAQGKP